MITINLTNPAMDKVNEYKIMSARNFELLAKALSKPKLNYINELVQHYIDIRDKVEINSRQKMKFDKHFPNERRSHQIG